MSDSEDNENADETVNPVGEFFCELCKLEFTTKPELEEHTWTILHHGKLNKAKGRDFVHECSLCQEQFLDLLSFTSHLHSDTHQEKHTAWKKKQHPTSDLQYTEELRPHRLPGDRTQGYAPPRGSRSRPPQRFHHRHGSRGSYRGWRGRKDNRNSPHDAEKRDLNKAVPSFESRWTDNGIRRDRRDQQRQVRWDGNGRDIFSRDFEGPHFFSFDFPHNNGNNKYHWLRRDSNGETPKEGTQNSINNNGRLPFVPSAGYPGPHWQVPCQVRPTYGYNKTFDPMPMDYRPGMSQPYSEYRMAKSTSSRFSEPSTSYTLSKSGVKASTSQSDILNTPGSTVMTSVSEQRTSKTDMDLDESVSRPERIANSDKAFVSGNEKEKEKGLSSPDTQIDKFKSNSSLQDHMGIETEPYIKMHTGQTATLTVDVSNECSFDDPCMRPIKQEPGLQDVTSTKEGECKGLDVETPSQCTFLHIDGTRCVALSSERYCSYHKRFKESEIPRGATSSFTNTTTERSSSVPLATKSTTLVNLDDTLSFKPFKLDEILNRDLSKGISFRRTSTQSEPAIDTTRTDTQTLSLGDHIDRETMSLGVHRHTQDMSLGGREDSQIISLGSRTDTQTMSLGDQVDRETMSLGVHRHTEDMSLGGRKDFQITSLGTSTDTQTMSLGGHTYSHILSFGTRTDTQTASLDAFNNQPDRESEKSGPEMIDLSFSTKHLGQPQTLSSSRTIETSEPWKTRDNSLGSTSKSSFSFSKRIENILGESSKTGLDMDSVNFRVKSERPRSVPVSLAPSLSTPRTASPVSPASTSRLSPSNVSAIRNMDFSRLNLPPNVRRELAIRYAASRQSKPKTSSTTSTSPASSSNTETEDWRKVKIKQERVDLGELVPSHSSTFMPPLPRLNRSSSLDSFPVRQSVLKEAIKSENTSDKLDFQIPSRSEANSTSSPSWQSKISPPFRRHSRSEGERSPVIATVSSRVDLPSRMIDLSTTSYLTSVASRDTKQPNTDELTKFRRDEDEFPTAKVSRLSSLRFKPSDELASTGPTTSSITTSLSKSDVPISTRITSVLSGASTKALDLIKDSENQLQRHGLLALDSSMLCTGDRTESDSAPKTDLLSRHGLMDLGSVPLPELPGENTDTTGHKRRYDETDIVSAKKTKLNSEKSDIGSLSYAPGVNVRHLLILECKEQAQMKILEATQDRIAEVRDKMQELAKELESLHEEEKKTANSISELKSRRLEILQIALRSGNSLTSQSSVLGAASTGNELARPSQEALYESRDTGTAADDPAKAYSHGGPATSTSCTAVGDSGRSETTTCTASEAPIQDKMFKQQNVTLDESVAVKIEVIDEEVASELASLGPFVSVCSDPSEGTMVFEAEPLVQASAEVPAVMVENRRDAETVTEGKLKRSPRKLPEVRQCANDGTPKTNHRSSILLPSKGIEVTGKEVGSRNRKELMRKMKHLHSGKKLPLGKRKRPSFSESNVSDTLALSRQRIQSVRERMKSWRDEQEDTGVESLASSSAQRSAASASTTTATSTCQTETTTATTVYYKDTPLTPSQVPVRDTRHPPRKTTKELKKSSMYKLKRRASESHEEDKQRKKTEAPREGANKDENQSNAKRKNGRHSRKKARTDVKVEKPDEHGASGSTAEDVDMKSRNAVNKNETTDAGPSESTPVGTHLQVPNTALESLKRQMQRKDKGAKSSSSGATASKFVGHTGAVCGMKVNHGRVFTCSADKTSKAFDIETSECIRTYEGHHHAVNCLETGACTHKFTFNGRVMCVHAAFDILFVGLSTGIVTCVDLKSNTCKERLHCHDPRGVSCLATATEGQRKLLCTGSFDATICIRDSSSGLLIRTIKSHNLTVLCMQVVENVLYSGAADCQVMAHDLNTGEILRKYSGHTLSVSGLQVVGRVVVTSSLDKLIRCYDSTSAELLQVYGGQKEMIFSVHMANGRIYSGARDGKVMSVKLDLRVYHPCKWEKCQLKFGILSHLKSHVTESHISGTTPNICRWVGCDHVFTDKTQKTIIDHVIAHIASRATKT